MIKIFGVLLTVILLHTSAHAADRIRIGFPDPSGTFLSLPLGQKPGFFQNEGIQAEFICRLLMQICVRGESKKLQVDLARAMRRRFQDQNLLANSTSSVRPGLLYMNGTTLAPCARKKVSGTIGLCDEVRVDNQPQDGEADRPDDFAQRLG